MTAEASQRWKKADNKTKLSVFGYIRQIERDLKGWNIPTSVQCYCVSYYFSSDYFTEHGDNIKINKNGNIAEGKAEFERNTVL